MASSTLASVLVRFFDYVEEAWHAKDAYCISVGGVYVVCLVVLVAPPPLSVGGGATN